jgi:hypothetical protein
MKKFFFMTLAALPAGAAVWGPVSTSYKFDQAPEYQAILAHLKTHGEFAAKTAPEPAAPKTLSRGEQLVEEAKALNRARLAELAAEEKRDAGDRSRSTLDQWKKEVRSTQDQWKKETRDLLATWRREQDAFLGRIPVYKKNTFKMPVKAEKILEAPVSAAAIPDAHVVNGTFAVPMKDQAARPTCVAFAGVRAIEILLAQNVVVQDLSEQYLYWAGKPNCQKAPCAEKGSWIRESYRFSKDHPAIDIPTEINCGYRTESVEKNETQLPLPESCRDGAVKVSATQEARTLAEVVDLVKRDVPVVVAARPTENFYRNKGLVTLADAASTGAKLDQHALGHAFLAVGVIELPEKLKETEGNFCLLVANSWGKGWGAGGYACVTEKWFLRQRQPAPFVAATAVVTR